MTDSSEDRDEFLQIYLEESSEETEQLVKLLLQLEEDPDDNPTLREAFRLLHTFKGSSGMMGYERINALAHELESRFDACRSGRERMTSEAVSVALRCVDFFRDFLGRLEEGNEDQGDPAPLIEELAGIAVLPVVAESTEETPASESAAADDESKQDAGQVAGAAKTPARKTPELEPVVTSAPSSEVGPVREVTVNVGLSDRVELPDLKARLIVARLQALGDVLTIDPPLETIEQVKPPITLRVNVRSAAEDHVFTDAIDLEGVASVEVVKTGVKAAEAGPAQEVVAKEEEKKPPAKAETAPERPAEEKPAEEKPAAEKPTATEPVAKKPVVAQQEPAATPPPTKRSGPARSGETIRVGIDRLDRLMNLAGELVVTNARFDQLAEEMRLLFRSGGSIEAGSPLAEALMQTMSSNGDPAGIPGIQDTLAGKRITGIVGNDGGSEQGAALRRGWLERGRRVSGQVSETVDRLARLSRSIQHAVLETRMIPVGPMFNRFRRTVRDIAMKQKKHVLLDLEGEMTELDKRMVDELGDPMVHLIRNSLDHGIESTEERVRRGKRPEGLIRLRAYHQSNHVVIEIEDDGAGIDASKVRARALERGLATEAELNMMSDNDVYDYIWHPGFSTADKVSDISGRGVGMDVVRNRIASLGGIVDLKSTPGLGSTVSIQLPLTLAIVNAMIVRFRGFRLAIPVTDVYEIYGLSRSEIFESQGREMIDVRGTLLPLYRLDELFEWNDFLPAQRRKNEGLVQAVLVRHGHRCLAIEVDDLDGNADIVVKSLDEHFSQIPGLGGACVMGDGEVCLVLDTASLRLINPNPHPVPRIAKQPSDNETLS